MRPSQLEGEEGNFTSQAAVIPLKFSSTGKANYIISVESRVSSPPCWHKIWRNSSQANGVLVDFKPWSRTVINPYKANWWPCNFNTIAPIGTAVTAMPLKTQKNLFLTHNKNNSNRHYGKSPQIVCNFKSKGILVWSNVITLLYFYKERQDYRILTNLLWSLS